MPDQTEQSIADSLGVDRQLLPYIPFLLQDLWALGSSVDYIIDVVGSLNLPPAQTKLLDLGCGKGAVSIQIASKFRHRVVGVDRMTAFLEDARQKASEYHVSRLCEFINQDIMEFVSTEHEFDLVILASLGGIFGTLKNTVAQLRTQVRPGGYMLIDDGYLRKAGSLKRKGYEHYKNHEDTIKELTAFGDLVLQEINTTDVSLKINDEYMSSIEKRAKQLVAQHPELENDINAYIQLQAEECDVIHNQIEGALWLLQKGMNNDRIESKTIRQP
ncbi:MAG TPA: class I SAM-dependent methyltransferase [Desulfobacteraceae bacterium]|nr:class I SAM-dependent methyltransferase [Desulfobacteraceae bacterium]